MRFIKNVFSQLHTFVLIALLTAVLWAWIFTFITDAPAEKKITVFFDCPAVEEKALDIELEKNLPDGIRMIRVHTFDYAMVEASSLTSGDIFIIRRSNMEQYAQDLAPLPGVFKNYDGNAHYYTSSDGVIRGLLIYKADLDSLVKTDCRSDLLGPDYVNYVFPDGKAEDCFLCFGANSVHCAGNEGAVDGCALAVACDLLGWNDD